MSHKLTWSELADFYHKETGNQARIHPMEYIFEWAEKHPKIKVNEDGTLSLNIEERIARLQDDELKAYNEQSRDDDPDHEDVNNPDDIGFRVWLNEGVHLSEKRQELQALLELRDAYQD